MITFIHGEDIVKSREYLFSEKQKNNVSLGFDGESISATELLQAMEGSGLFGEKPTIFIENLFAKKKSKEELKKIITILNEHKDITIYLWEAKEISAKEYQQFKDANVKHFSLPKSIFIFLDNFRPNNGQQLIKILNQTLNESPIEQIMFMLIRQVRILLALSFVIIDSRVKPENDREEIDEVKRLSPWQKNKLLSQMKLFSSDKLKQIHHNLFEIDKDAKTGKLSMPLRETIDFFIINI